MNVAGVFALSLLKQHAARGIDLPLSECEKIMSAVILEVHDIAAGMMMPAPVRSRSPLRLVSDRGLDALNGGKHGNPA